MKWIKELSLVLIIILLTVVLVALLWQLPVFLAFVLLVPLGLSLLLWPHPSTILSYIVAAIVGTLLTGWSWVATVEQPQAMQLSFLWLPLVWGPAGVVIKRLEILVRSAWLGGEDEFDLPEL